MAKQTKQNKNLWGSFGLEFVGSVIYLVVVFTALTGGSTMAALSGGIWQPVLAGIAVIGAISLFFMSFANFSGMKYVGWGAMRASTLTGFALVGLTLGTGGLFVASLLGFILSFLGAGMTVM